MLHACTVPCPQSPVRCRVAEGSGSNRREVLMRTYSTHREGLLRTAMRLLGCRSRAEDVVQDAFVKMLENELNCTDPAGYMFRVVRNLSIDHLRRQNLEWCHGGEADDDDASSCDLSPERVFAGRESVDRLVRALNELPQRMRVVFDLNRLQGYTQRDVAQVIGTSPTMVNFLLRDTLTHCRARLGEI
ncbi:putative ECF RNA polymerase sigma factor SigI [compost metagenome]